MNAPNDRDPFAFAGPEDAAADPVVALVDEWFRLWDECNALSGRTDEQVGADVARTLAATEAIEQRPSGMVATTAAGVVAEIRMLMDLLDDGRDEGLFNAITAGVERLAAGGGA